MRKKFIAGNWKMHKTSEEAVVLAEELKNSLSACKHKLMIAPPFTALEAVGKTLKNGNILLGAQNMSFEEQGAHTGEISVLMLKAIGVSVVILGHSERRHTYKESDEIINKKVRLVIKHGLEVILCVGELLEEREAGNAEIVVEKQIELGLKGVSANELSTVTIAYEPVWAIGTGKTATPKDADDIHKVIRAKISSMYDEKTADNLIIQYGGSVKADNAADLLNMENIDGALVGGASLKSELFLPIVNFNIKN